MQAKKKRWLIGIPFLLCGFSCVSYAQAVYEIDGSAFSTQNAPLSQHRHSVTEKVVVVNPRDHVWGAYNAKGKLLRWGIATAGSDQCLEDHHSCRTSSGHFRIYLLGAENCTSSKFPVPTGGAPMPYCMYFNGNQALHGSDNVEYGNASHGCVRIHVDDAKWLRYHFVEGPTFANHYRGTQVIIQSY